MAGRGTRVRPHAHTTPKPLLPVAGTMIIERIVETFARTMDRTVTEIVYILGPDFGKEIERTLTKMSERHHAKAVFRVQETALGTAHAVACAKEDLEGEVIIVFADTLFDSKEKVSVEDADSVIWLKEVEDPSRFGVAVHENDQITGFVEKPKELISKLAIIGVYYFRKGEDLMKEIQYLIDHDITGHGKEYQLTDALDRLLKDGKIFRKATVDEWLDCGTLAAWLDTSSEILRKENHSYNTYPGTTIKPPVYIGDGVTIEGCEIGPNVAIESGSTLTKSQIRNSIVQSGATIEDSSLHGSTIGKRAIIRGINGEIHVGDDSQLAGK